MHVTVQVSFFSCGIGLQVVLFVYDMTNSESFRNLEQWVTAVKTIVDDRERLDAEEGKRKIKMTHFTLVANKCKHSSTS